MKKLPYFRISFFLYLISMSLPVFNFDWNFLGLQALYLGWFGLAEGQFLMSLPWMANLLFFINLIIKPKYHNTRLFLSVLTLLFGFVAIAFRGLHLGIGGNPEDVQMGPGFYLWMLSFLALFIDQIIKKTSTP